MNFTETDILSVKIGIVELDTVIAMLNDLKERLEKDVGSSEDKRLLTVQRRVAENVLNDLSEKKKKMWDAYYKESDNERL